MLHGLFGHSVPKYSFFHVFFRQISGTHTAHATWWVRYINLAWKWDFNLFCCVQLFFLFSPSDSGVYKLAVELYPVECWYDEVVAVMDNRDEKLWCLSVYLLALVRDEGSASRPGYLVRWKRRLFLRSEERKFSAANRKWTLICQLWTHRLATAQTEPSPLYVAVVISYFHSIWIWAF